eukprot:CAMPEP_0204914738 /NCGR_PEP_ID=MMETSP1397-20131031/12637_1 /ASSEMBLY_ACC=CAM_ASM_000891 /TAXON_ID=49980 /ORGANISM="Climacostomum Climacostomum virens, Strain Stock W-24" /LENGTH=367 /DNA_ID=CAMNT_0052086447 /DNA_START=983 /DNA_END=2083 /DNA_ORIENTATION=+
MDSSQSFEGQRPTVNVVARAIAGLLLVIIVPLEVLLQNNLEFYGGKLIYSMQENLHSEGAEAFFNTMNNVGNNLTMLIATAILFHTCEPVKAVKFCIVTCTGMFLASLLNMLYAEPRPYWVYGHIDARFCNRSYATPSYLLVLVQVCVGYMLIEYKIIRILRIIFGTAFGLLLLLLFYGQLYLGQLFPHQIVITSVFSFVYVIGCLMFDTTLSQIVKRSSFNYKKNRINVVRWYLGTVALLLAAVTIYDEITLGYEINIQWIKHATADCDFEYDVGNSYSFFNSSLIFFQLGLVVGTMFLHRYFSESWWRTDRYKRYLRAFIASGIIVSMYFLFGLIPNQDTTTEYTFNYALPYYFSGGLVTLPLVW